MTPSSKRISRQNEPPLRIDREGNVGNGSGERDWFWIRAISDVVREHDASSCRLIARCTRRRRRYVQLASAYLPAEKSRTHWPPQWPIIIWHSFTLLVACGNRHCSATAAATPPPLSSTKKRPVVFHAPNQLAERASSLVPRALITP